jgi:hypothetical protein
VGNAGQQNNQGQQPTVVTNSGEGNPGSQQVQEPESVLKSMSNDYSTMHSNMT